MHHTIKNICLWAIASLTILSCDLTDNEDPAPAFIQIDEVTTTGGQGAQTDQIEDVHVFVDGQAIGVWPLPARIPIVATGSEQKISFLAGVRLFGVQSMATTHPFLGLVEIDRTFEVGETVQLNDLSFPYLDNVEYEFVEGFETRNIFSDDKDDFSANNIQRSNEASRSGNFGGLIQLTDSTGVFEAATQFTYSVADIDGQNLYLELDYKSEAPILVGVTSLGQFLTDEWVVLISESEEWKKMYIDLGPTLLDDGADNYQVKLGSGLEESDLSEAKIYIDNIKLMHF